MAIDRPKTTGGAPPACRGPDSTGRTFLFRAEWAQPRGRKLWRRCCAKPVEAEPVFGQIRPLKGPYGADMDGSERRRWRSRMPVNLTGVFTGGFAHPRQAMRVVLHAPRPVCPARSQVRFAARTVRPPPPHGHGPRRRPHADPHTAPYRHPDDRDGIPALIRSRLIGSSAVSGAHGRSVRRVGGHTGNAEEGGNTNGASADDGEDHLPCLRGHHGPGDPEGRVEPSQDCGYDEDQRAFGRDTRRPVPPEGITRSLTNGADFPTMS